MIRVAHLSDVHVYCPSRWEWRDWFSKRLSGWLNVRVFPRSKLFHLSAEMLEKVVGDIYERRPDLIVFSGDATALGFEEELAMAAKLLRVGETGSIPGIAAPGNHDYYTRWAAASGLFERSFAPWMEGERVRGHLYPFARKVGPVYWIAVNSSKGNRWYWDATGEVGAEQRSRLKELLARPEIACHPKILMTHYPIALADGRPEPWHHGLTDLKETLEIAQAGGVSAWLHGHRHHPYSLASPIPSICSGSGTELDCWSYAEYTITEEAMQVEWRRYWPVMGKFRPGQRVGFKL